MICHLSQSSLVSITIAWPTLPLSPHSHFVFLGNLSVTQYPSLTRGAMLAVFESIWENFNWKLARYHPWSKTSWSCSHFEHAEWCKWKLRAKVVNLSSSLLYSSLLYSSSYCGGDIFSPENKCESSGFKCPQLKAKDKQTISKQQRSCHKSLK